MNTRRFGSGIRKLRQRGRRHTDIGRGMFKGDEFFVS